MDAIEFTKAVRKLAGEASWFVLKLLFAIYVISFVLAASPFGRDSTDYGVWGFTRSGMELYSDAATGCQYLGTARGGLTPRIGTQGEHVGCR